MDVGAGGKYRTSGSDTEGSADKHAKWGTDDTEELALVAMRQSKRRGWVPFLL